MPTIRGKRRILVPRRLLRQKTPNFGFISSSKFDDVVEATRCFLDRKPDSSRRRWPGAGGGPGRQAARRAGRTTWRLPRLPVEGEDEQSKILTVGGEGWRGPKPVIGELGVQVMEIPYAG